MAYTKYSLTPANNNAAPPDGAPEGMLPSAVNDTMRDMMAQIRDAGDGIRNGTYTMTAPVITGGSITGVALSGNTLTNPVITGGSINNTPIGATTANTGAFTTLGASGVATFSAGTVSAPAITTTGDTNTGIFFPAADTIGFAEGGTEVMRIDSSGNLLVGTTSNWFSRKIVAEGTTEAIGGLVSDVGGYPVSCLNSATSGDNIFVGFWTDSRGIPVARGTIDYNRSAGLVRYNTTSDATLKNIIGDANKQKSIDILNSTKIREYAWKNDVEQKSQIGVIAQELYETYKGAVSVGGEDAKGKYKPWGVDKTAFTFHLIAGWQAHEKLIQEQQAMIETLTTRLNALEKK